MHGFSKNLEQAFEDQNKSRSSLRNSNNSLSIFYWDCWFLKDPIINCLGENTSGKSLRCLSGEVEG